MFDTLVESGSHREDMARKGSFLFGTAVVYGVLLLGLVVGSILWYQAELEALDLELTTLVAPVPIQQNQPEPEQQQQKQQQQPKQSDVREVATRTEFIANVTDATKIPDKVSAVASKVPPIPPGGAVLGRSNTDPVGGVGPIGPGTGGPIGGSGTAASGPVIDADEPPPPPPPKRTAPISGGVLNGKAVSKPAPPYPAIAKAARAQGTVTVQILVDEDGRVISAKAVGGHPLLQQAAVQAARQARFTPTLLSGQPVKVSGVITYNFVLQ
jgi:periplasmic protein TonB